jgi:hypothetical protein
MSLLDLASLVLAPTATKEGKVYSAIPDTGDGDMTFSRGSAATRVNSAGLIEKERGNLLLQSNTFDTTWTNARLTTLSDGQSGYDGLNDAWSVVPNTANDDHKIYQSVAQTGVITFSVYAKANGYNGLALVSSNTNNGKFFNLSNGTLGNDFNSSPIDSTITEVSNGWYRCEVVFNVSAGNFFTIYVSSDGTSTHSFSGNGTDGILIQDAMLNQGLVAQSYIETTTTAVYEGITDDVPRVDYSGGGCPSLLLEGQRTNLITQSEYFGAWTLNNVLITNNDTTSPEGLDNAAKWSASSGLSQKNIYQVLTCSSGVAHTTSVYFKADEYPLALIRLGGITDSPYVIYDLRDESVVSTSGLTSHTIESVANDWYRIDATATTSSTVIAPNFAFLPESGYTLTSLNIPQYTGDGTSGGYIYGAQVESSASYVSSYIPTYGVSSTRVADSCSKTGISELIGQSEGVVYVEYDQKLINQGITRRIFALSDGTTSNRITAYINSANGIDFYVRNSGGDLFLDQASSPIGNTKGVHKIAAAYKNGDYAVYLDGVQIISGAGTAGTIPSCSRFDLGSQIGSNNLYEPMMQSLLFPTRLTNTELADLTTL